LRPPLTTQRARPGTARCSLRRPGRPTVLPRTARCATTCASPPLTAGYDGHDVRVPTAPGRRLTGATAVPHWASARPSITAASAGAWSVQAARTTLSRSRRPRNGRTACATSALRPPSAAAFGASCSPAWSVRQCPAVASECPAPAYANPVPSTADGRLYSVGGAAGLALRLGFGLGRRGRRGRRPTCIPAAGNPPVAVPPDLPRARNIGGECDYCTAFPPLCYRSHVCMPLYSRVRAPSLVVVHNSRRSQQCGLALWSTAACRVATPSAVLESIPLFLIHPTLASPLAFASSSPASLVVCAAVHRPLSHCARVAIHGPHHGSHVSSRIVRSLGVKAVHR